MKTVLGPWILVLVSLAWASQAAAQERRPWASERPGAAGPPSSETDPMLWERDFDLLLELKNIPTKGQLLKAARRRALEEEREGLASRQEDLKKRLAQIQGTYSTEFLLNEMMRLDVTDFQSVQAKLKDELKTVTDRLAEVDREMRKLARLSHQPSAAGADRPVPAASGSVSHLDVVHEYACGGLSRLPCIHGPLHPLAAISGEKAGPGPATG